MKQFLLFAILFITLGIKAQVANDECVTATVIQINNTIEYTVTPGTVFGATASPQANPCIGSADDDVWFEFVATATFHPILLSNIAGSNTGLNYAIYEGSCGNLTKKYCSNATSNSNLASGLIVGQPYKIRVYTSTNLPGQTTTFNVCVAGSPPPANDNFFNAVVLPVSEQNTPLQTTSGTIYGATYSSDVTGCAGTSRDVWYQFTSTGQPIKVKLLNNFENIIYNFSVYNNDSPVLASCSGNMIPALPAGNLYKLRVGLLTFPITPAQGIFTIGLSNASPLNDECNNALQVTVNQPLASNNYVQGNTYSATQSNPPASCAGSNDDVWFKFTATGPNHYISIFDAGTTDLMHAVYAQGCNSATELYCSDPNDSSYANYIAGQTYWIRVFTRATSSTSVNAPFSLKITTPLPAPSNSTCATAITVPISADTQNACEQSVSGHVHTINPAILYQDRSWFKFTAPSTSVKINFSDVSSNGLTSLRYSVYNGDCTNMSIYTSTNSISSDGYLHMLTVGNTYYIAVTTSSVNYTGYNFKLCVTSIVTPPNDNCANATTLTVNPTMEPVAGVAYSMASISQDQSVAYCTSSPNSSLDVWYQFTATSTSHILKTDAGYIYKVLYKGDNCTALTQQICNLPADNLMSGLTVGQTYKLRLYVNLSKFSNEIYTGNIYILTPPSAPVNDICSGSLTVPVNTTIEPVNYITATTTMATIDSFDFSGKISIWFKFTATSDKHQIKFFDNQDIIPESASIYYDCGSFVNQGTNNQNNWQLSNLAPGATYFIKLLFPQNIYNPGQANSFKIAILTVPQPPANDDCSNAVAIPINNSIDCATSLICTLTGSTASAFTDSCASSGSRDVWYKFIATASEHILLIDNSFGSYNFTSQLYKGEDCNSLQCISGIMNNLEVGAQYYVRLYTSASPFTNVTVNICLRTPIASINDECTGALVVPVNSDIVPQNYLQTHVGISTLSANACNASSMDVWYKFVATHTGHGVMLFDPTSSTNTNLRHGLYSGNCDALTPLYCNSEGFASGLVIGQTYYIRVWGFSYHYDNPSFKVAVITNPNDDCDNPRHIPVSADTTCIQTTGSFIGSTVSPTPTVCSGNPLRDVWYEFTATSSRHIVKTDRGSFTVYGGTCDNFYQVYCNGTGGILEDLVPGENYMIRVLLTDVLYNEFKICVITPPIFCEDAEPFITGYDSYVFPNTINTDYVGSVGCITFRNPKWFKIEISNPGSLTFNVSQSTVFDSYGNAIGSPLDVDMVAFGPFTSLNEGCQNLSSVNVISCDASTANTADFTIENTNQGEIYLILITNFSNQNGFIKFAQTGGTGSIAVPTPVADNEQTLGVGSTLADIDIEGQTIQWYDASGASTGRNVQMMEADEPLPLTTVLVDGATYYASQTIYGVESLGRKPVTVHLVLGLDDINTNSLKFYPNPVENVLTISNKDIIKKYEIYSPVGQLITESTNDDDTLQVNMQAMQSGIYMVKVYSENSVQVLRIIKQ